MVTRISQLVLAFVFASSCLAGAGNSVWGLPQDDEDDAAVAASESGQALPSQGIIDFARDVSPIFADKCLECHGPKKAKNDFRVDISTSLLDYIEPGDAEGSSLWTDYLTTDDEDMRMPPTTAEQPRSLTAAELATIKLWIEEGGMWNIEAERTAVPEIPPVSMAARIWHFQGLFHPATVHFPIALLTVSAFFVLLSFVRPNTCEPVAFHCLWIGALGSIVASAAGWAYAVHAGYGPSFSFDLFNSAIDRHRWLGIAVASLAVLLIPVASYVRRTKDFGMRLVWLIGSLVVMAGVSITGFQGGELTYGEGHYEKEFIRLFPEVLMPEEKPAEEVDVAAPAEIATESAEPMAAVAEVEEPLAETSTAETAETPADETAETPADESAETPTDEPAETPTDETAETPTDETAETPTDETAETPTDETAETPTDESAETPTDESAETQEVLQDSGDSARPPSVAQPPALAD